jgi:hypothetical protein
LVLTKKSGKSGAKALEKRDEIAAVSENEVLFLR